MKKSRLALVILCIAILTVCLGAAACSPTYFTLTYSAGEGGSITGDNIQQVKEGESGTAVTVKPNAGYVFTGWSDGVTTAERTDTAVTADINVTAQFRALNSFTLQYSAGEGGNISGNTAQQLKEGEVGTAVTAQPLPGFVFTGWSDGVTSPERTDSSATAVTALFEKNPDCDHLALSENIVCPSCGMLCEQNTGSEILMWTGNENDPIIAESYSTSADFLGVGVTAASHVYISSAVTDIVSMPYGLQEVIFQPGSNLKNIGANAFSGRPLKRITLPEGVLTIGDGAFSSTQLTSTHIPSSVTSLGKRTFDSCELLEEVTFADDCKITLLDSCFWECANLKHFTIPDSVTELDATFMHSGITEIYFPESIISMDASSPVIAYCENLERVTFAEDFKITTLPNAFFLGCTSLKSVELPASVTAFGDGIISFAYCRNLTSVTVHEDNPVFYSESNCIIERTSKTVICGAACSAIPSDIAAIKDYAFTFVATLESIDIPDSVTSIGEYAFSTCVDLASVTLGNSVTSIGDSVFENCYKLESIVIPASVTDMGRNVFVGCHNLTIYCEAESRPAGWSENWNSGGCLVVWGYKG